MLKLLCRKKDKKGISLTKRLMILKRNKELIVYTKTVWFAEINDQKTGLYYDKNTLKRM
jgi:hypothetical protein